MARVRPAEDDLDRLLNVLDKNDVPRSETRISLVETEPPTLILYEPDQGLAGRDCFAGKTARIEPTRCSAQRL